MFQFSDGGRGQSKRPQSKNDCTVRAYATVKNISFDAAYDLLANNGRDSHRRFDMKTFLNTQSDFEWFALQAVKGESRITPVTFCYKFPTGKYILRLSHHVIACIDGKYFDEIPCIDRCVYGAWIIK